MEVSYSSSDTRLPEVSVKIGGGVGVNVPEKSIINGGRGGGDSGGGDGSVSGGGG